MKEADNMIDRDGLIKLYESVSIPEDKILILTKDDIQRGYDEMIKQQTQNDD